MKQNTKNIQDDIINISEIIKNLWNEKILILSISLIFMVIGYVYGVLQPKIYKTEMILREAPSSLFEIYLTLQQQQDITKQFNDNLKLDLSSLDTLVQFVENNNNTSNFKNYLEEKNVSARNYFRGKFGLANDKKKNIQNKYFLIYSQYFPGESFLNDYIIFVSKKIFTILNNA
jgi:LPS O-antigen subunit length determinant protein (WzzB/FepE family)